MTGAKRRYARGLRTLASWLAAAPLFSVASGAGGVDAAILESAPHPIERRLWPADLPEQLIRLLPGDALETAARTLVERKVEVRLDRDRAFLQVRIPLG